MNMKVSVVVPVYNLQNELEQCVCSILKQTHHDLEILLVDDGSTDGSRTVIQNLAELDKRIVPIYKENGGVTSARLRGVQEASGEWIGFVDGDDEIELDMYERLLNHALQHNAQISHCGYQMVFPDGRVNYFYNTGLLAEQDKITALKELLSGERIEPGLCNKLFHKNLFHSLLHDGVMPEDIKINEDLLMNFYLFSEADTTVFEDVCRYHYLVRGFSASRGKTNVHRIMDPVRVKEIILDSCPEEIRSDALRAYMRTVIYSYNGVLWKREFRAQKRSLHITLAQQKRSFALLPPKQRLMAEMIVHAPHIYALVYPVYEKLFQKKRYC